MPTTTWISAWSKSLRKNELRGLRIDTYTNRTEIRSMTTHCRNTTVRLLLHAGWFPLASALLVGFATMKSGLTEDQQTPSYLAGYEQLYRKDPHVAAVAWFKEAKFGLFVHYALASVLEGGKPEYAKLTAHLEKQIELNQLPASERARLGVTDEELAPLRRVLGELEKRFRAERFDAAPSATWPWQPRCGTSLSPQDISVAWPCTARRRPTSTASMHPLGVTWLPSWPKQAGNAGSGCFCMFRRKPLGLTALSSARTPQSCASCSLSTAPLPESGSMGSATTIATRRKTLVLKDRQAGRCYDACPFTL